MLRQITKIYLWYLTTQYKKTNLPKSTYRKLVFDLRAIVLAIEEDHKSERRIDFSIEANKAVNSNVHVDIIVEPCDENMSAEQALGSCPWVYKRVQDEMDLPELSTEEIKKLHL